MTRRLINLVFSFHSFSCRRENNLNPRSSQSQAVGIFLLFTLASVLSQYFYPFFVEFTVNLKFVFLDVLTERLCFLVFSLLDATKCCIVELSLTHVWSVEATAAHAPPSAIQWIPTI